MVDEEWLAIRKRPSGGRGEYELTGTNRGIEPRDLAGLHFSIKLCGRIYATHVRLTRQGDKNRFRLDNPHDRKGQTHIPGICAAMLMMPAPCRVESKTTLYALPVLRQGAYLLDIKCRVVDIQDKTAVVEPVLLEARAGDSDSHFHKLSINVKDRINDIVRLLGCISNEPDFTRLHSLLLAYRDAMKTGTDSCYTDCRSSVDAIMETLDKTDEDYLTSCDPLPFLMSKYGIGELDAHGDNMPSPEDLPPASGGIHPEEDLRRRIRAERWYRRLEQRGSGTRTFAAKVIKAYSGKCLVCGGEMPTLQGGRAGIEAAHILPWAQYDLDVLPNGLALCRNHHWAFDNRVIALVGSAEKGYSVKEGVNYGSYESKIRDSENALASEIRTHIGEEVDRRLLPSDASLRPSGDYLYRFNTLFS